MATEPIIDETEETELIECPKCLELSAEEVEGKWECANGCDLGGYRQCARCSTLFRGPGPFCVNDCDSVE